MAFPNYNNPYSYMNYLPYQQQQMQQPMQQIQQPIQQNAQPVIHNGGLVNVQSEQEARNYPVAPATSVTFHNENEPYIYTKTMGMNTLEPPKFEKFKLIKEESEESVSVTEKDNNITYAEKSELEALRAEFEALKEELTTTKKKAKVKNDE